MEPLPRILWSEGLFLTPQHLQQQDRGHAAAIAAVWREAAPFRWGIARFELREDAIGRGLAEVAAVVAVTREGVFVKGGGLVGGGANARIRPLALGDGMVLGATTLYLCLAREQPGVPPVASEAELAQSERLARRYLAETSEFADAEDIDQTDRVTLTRLPFLLQLAAVPEGPAGQAARAALEQGFDVLPVARLLPKGEGFATDPDFVPPALSLGAVPYLLHRAASLADRMLGRIAEIEPELGTRRLQAELGVPTNLAIFLVLRSLHEHASAILQATEMRETHPTELYFRLRQAVADLSAFSPSVTLRGEVAASGEMAARPALPPYAHDDLGWRVLRAIETIDLLMDGLGSGAQISVELQFSPPERWSARIAPDFFHARVTRYFLLVESTLQSSEVEQLLAQRKIASAADLSQLIASNLYGLPIKRLADPPRGLPARTGRYTYFEITTDSPDWKAIRSRGDIVVFCPELAKHDVRIRLFREPTTD